MSFLGTPCASSLGGTADDMKCHDYAKLYPYPSEPDACTNPMPLFCLYEQRVRNECYGPGGTPSGGGTLPNPCDGIWAF